LDDFLVASMSADYVIASFCVVPGTILVWLWVRWRRFTGEAKPSLFRRVMTLLSLGALSASVLAVPMLATFVFLEDDRSVELREDLREIALLALWSVGLVGAILGGFLAASAVDTLRDKLGLVAFLLTIMWVALATLLEPGA
jgi:fructose-specific phosphotransferase system IIC component